MSVTVTIFWSVPRGQSFYIQFTYNSFTIETMKSKKKTEKDKTEKTESKVDSQSENSYLPVPVQLPNSQWDTKDTWNSNDANHTPWMLSRQGDCEESPPVTHL